MRYNVGKLGVLFISVLGFRVAAFIGGIDIGREYSKFAIVLPKRAPEVVVNTQSKRKTPTAFFVAGQTRAFGESALQHLTSAASGVARFFPQFLGQKVNNLSSAVASGFPVDFFPFKLSADNERWTYKFNVGDLVLSVEEVLAHFLAFGNSISTEAANKQKIQEAVMTVPAMATQRHRQALLHSAEIAGIPKVRLIHEISAAAIQRALDIESSPPKMPIGDDTDEDLEPKEDDSPKEKLRKIQAKRAKQKELKKAKAASQSFLTTVLFFNMGARHLEVCIARYKVSGKDVSIHMKGCGSSEHIGGHFMDLTIASKMRELAAAQHKPGELESNPKALQKILAQATKTKHLLSANKEALFAIEALHSDTDFAYTITRTEFESWCRELFPLITKPIDAALTNSGMKLIDVDAIEVIGGGWRVPWVQQVLSDYLAEKRGADAKPLSLGQHLNGDEAAALGAGYFAASNSEITRGPRLRPFKMHDISLHEYALSIRKLDSSQPGNDLSPAPQVVFKRGATLGAPVRNLQLNSIPFDMRVTLFEDGRAIEVHRVTGLHKAHAHLYKDSDAPNITLPVELDGNGIVNIGHAVAEFQALEKPKVDKKKQTSIAPKKVKKKVTLQDAVEYEHPVPMSRRQRLEARQSFRQLGERDRAATLSMAARSNLEAYLFGTREQLSSSEVKESVSEDKLAELQIMLNEVESWLEQNSAGVVAQKYIAKLNMLKREVTPILGEASENSAQEEKANHARTESPKERAARIARKNEARRKREEAQKQGEL